jgi:hypothetical protein
MKDDRLLLAFALGTFHAVLLTLLLVFGAYLLTSIGEAFEDLSTPIGLAVFGVLWASSVYCTSRGLRDSGMRPGKEVSALALLNNAVTWGAWNGVSFLWVLLTVGLLVLLFDAASESADQVAGVIVFGVILFGAGTIFATFIGAFFGVVLTLIDIRLLIAARWMAGDEARTEHEQEAVSERPPP